jgi:predicted TIM-barrel enzyme
MYDNPNYAKCNEAKQMIKIGDIIVEEFGVREFSIKK